jgi:hypothetical protein
VPVHLPRPPSEAPLAVQQQADTQSSISSKANPLHVRETTTTTWGYGGGIGSFNASTISEAISGLTWATLPASTVTVSSCSPAGGVETCSPSVITIPAPTLTSTITQCPESQGTCTATTISIVGPPSVITSCSQETCEESTKTVTSVLSASCTNVGGVQTSSPSTVVSTRTITTGGAISTVSGDCPPSIPSTVSIPGTCTASTTTIQGNCPSSSCTPVTLPPPPPVTITTRNTCPLCTPAGPIETVTFYQTITTGSTCPSLICTPVTFYRTTTAFSTIGGGGSTETIYSTVSGPVTINPITVTSNCTPVQPAQTITSIITSIETLTARAGTSTIISTVTSTLQGGKTTITQTIPGGTSTIVSTVISTRTVGGSQTTVSYSLQNICRCCPEVAAAEEEEINHCGAASLKNGPVKSRMYRGQHVVG